MDKKNDAGAASILAAVPGLPGGRLPVSLQGGVVYQAETLDAGSAGFRFRLQARIVLI
jgi:hypothetical protein